MGKDKKNLAKEQVIGLENGEVTRKTDISQKDLSDQIVVLTGKRSTSCPH